MPPEQQLEIRCLEISLGASSLINSLDLTVTAGETVALMGASGSGKSTLLSWLCGVLDPAFRATGELHLAGKRIDQLPCEQRRVGLLFQDALLFPHFSVGENLMFAAPAELSKQRRRAGAHEALEEAGLAGFFTADPCTLSGGQRARVSLLRTLLAEPQAVLLDEPYSRLDPALRAQFRAFVQQHIADKKLPTLLVTHDFDDVPQNSRCLLMEELAKR